MRFTEHTDRLVTSRRDPNGKAAASARRLAAPSRTRQSLYGLVQQLLSPAHALQPTAALLHGQAISIQIPSTTPLSVQLPHHLPMKAGEPLEGRLLYPVYVDNQIAIPADTVLRGSVIQLDSDRSRRIHSRLRGDFTPFHIPVVRFDQLILPDGTRRPIVSDSAKDGVPILRLSPPPGKKKGSFVTRQIAQGKQQLKDTAALFTKPGRGDRLVQFIYSQLPYHPERIETGTSWTIELVQPLTLEFRPPEVATDPVDHGGSKQAAEAESGTGSRDRMAATCISTAIDQLCQGKVR